MSNAPSQARADFSRAFDNASVSEIKRLIHTVSRTPRSSSRSDRQRPVWPRSRAVVRSGPADQAATVNDGIAGMSAMRGLRLYGAVLGFAGLYIHFIVVISTSKNGVKPTIGATMISAAAALSGVLGSAFALKIGVAANPSLFNSGLAAHTAAAQTHKASAVAGGIRKALSLEPSDPNAKSRPLTFGIWVYAAVASAVVGV
jgi:hypothetical protein